MKDLNAETHCEGSVIRAAEFHPTSAVALVAGINGTASLFQVDGRLNPKIQTVNFEGFPIRTAHFSSDGREFICSSDRSTQLHVFDLGRSRANTVEAGRGLDGQGSLRTFEVSPAGDFLAVPGRFGNVHMLSARTKEKLFSVKMNDDVSCVAFGPEERRELYTHGGKVPSGKVLCFIIIKSFTVYPAGGEVYLWDVRQTRSCVHRFSDDGCVRGTALAISPDGRHLATGADSGVVNLYDARY